MQAAMESQAVEPTDDEIRSYIAANPQEFSSLPRYRLSYEFESKGASTLGGESAGRSPDERGSVPLVLAEPMPTWC